jgi:hypothetical protein
MASRAHRLHHFLWHEVRNRWLVPSAEGGLTDDVKAKLKDLGWEPPRPALDAKRNAIINNDSGEDFLFMHRQMIAGVNQQLKDIGDPTYTKVEGWLTIPEPTDKDYPVPPAWKALSIADKTQRETIFERLSLAKSDEFYYKRFRFWEKQFTDPNYLKGMSLGELGSRLEFTIHNQLHNRFSAKPFGDRPDPHPDPEGTIPAGWDDEAYDFLGDTYSSHVNQVFWKLHGWVDDRIEDWRFANAVFGPISWKGTWEGVRPDMTESLARAAVHDHGHDHDHDQHLKQMEEAARVIGECPGSYSFLGLGWVID